MLTEKLRAMFTTNGQQLSTGTSKSIQAGVVYARVISGQLKTSGKGDKKAVELYLETEALDNFEGWPIDRDNPEGPKHKGQTGRVMATVWTDEFNNPNIAKNEIMSKLTVIAQELGVRDQVNMVTASTIEEWVQKVLMIIKDQYAFWFLKGQEEEYNGKTYVKLSLPKYKFVSKDKSKLDEFDKNNKYHFKALEVKPVTGFGDEFVME